MRHTYKFDYSVYQNLNFNNFLSKHILTINESYPTCAVIDQESNTIFRNCIADAQSEKSAVTEVKMEVYSVPAHKPGFLMLGHI